MYWKFTVYFYHWKHIHALASAYDKIFQKLNTHLNFVDQGSYHYSLTDWRHNKNMRNLNKLL